MTEEVERARLAHSRRPLRERVADELTTEELTEDVRVWLRDPKRYDFPRVDVESPLRFEVVEEDRPKERGVVDGRIDGYDGAGRHVGVMMYTMAPDGFHYDLVKVFPGEKGKGYSVFLLRKAVGRQDELCLPGVIEPSPYAGEKSPPVERAYERQMELLVKLYSSFGFKLRGARLEECFERPCVMDREPVCRAGGGKLKGG